MTVVRFETARMPPIEARGSWAGHSAGGGARRAVARFRQWRRRARDRAQLAALDDRMLADIGISRAQAEFLINKPFWRS